MSNPSTNESMFCNQCGMLLSQCTCDAKLTPVPESAPAQANPVHTPKKAPASKKTETSYIRRFDKVALIQDEVIVRQYNVGQFDKGLGRAGKGEATVIITNKRVISKQNSQCFGTSHTSLEELALDNIAGVKNYYSQGLTLWRIAAAISLFFVGIPLLFDGKILIALLLFAAAAYMTHTSRKPSYLFSVYASATGSAMEMGVNLRGKLFNSAGNGILFQYKPTEEAVNMMLEMGACIMELKTKGNFAVDKWKKG